LHKLNKTFAKNFEVTDTYPEYIPHVTIAYVKKGLGKKYEGKDDFEGKEVLIDNITFSGKDNRTTVIQFPKEDIEDYKIVACDFDGTIVKNNDDLEKTEFEFMPDAKKVLKWIAQNFYLILWTCRSGQYLENAKNFLDEEGIEYKGINENASFLPFSTSNKIFANEYIDDRATVGGKIDWMKIKDFLAEKYLKAPNRDN